MSINAKRRLYEGLIVSKALFGADIGLRSAERRIVNVLEMRSGSVWWE